MRLIDADALYDELDSIGGCGADKETWEAGWDDAITEAINRVIAAPTIKLPIFYLIEHARNFKKYGCDVYEENDEK